MKRAYYDLFNPETGTVNTVAMTEEDALRCTQDLQFAMQLIHENHQKGELFMSAGAEEEPLALISTVTPSASTASVTEGAAEEPLAVRSTVVTPSTSTVSVTEGAEEGPLALRSTVTPSTSTVSVTEDTIYRWREQNILLLLNVYDELQEKFSDPKISLKKAWMMVAEEANKRIVDFKVTGPQCMTKMRSLKKTYKIIKDHNSKSGNDRKTWKYYEKMNEIFGTRAWATPVALVSSDQPPPETASVDIIEETDTNQSSSQPIQITSRRLRDNRQSSIIKLLEAKIEQRERHEAARQARHEERLASDQALIQTIKDLFGNGQ